MRCLDMSATNPSKNYCFDIHRTRTQERATAERYRAMHCLDYNSQPGMLILIHVVPGIQNFMLPIYIEAMSCHGVDLFPR